MIHVQALDCDSPTSFEHLWLPYRRWYLVLGVGCWVLSVESKTGNRKNRSYSFMKVCQKCPKKKKKSKTLLLAAVNTGGCQLWLETLSVYGRPRAVLQYDNYTDPICTKLAAKHVYCTAVRCTDVKKFLQLSAVSRCSTLQLLLVTV